MSSVESRDTTMLDQAIQLFDDANSKDPNISIDEQGHEVPGELLYAQRMTTQLLEFEPQASLHLQLAARAQHIERWTSKRSDYPEGRAGYKKWRSQLMLFHAARAGELMQQAGFKQEDIERVQYLIQKRQLRRDPETQSLEDVICLVFLKHYLRPFVAKHPLEKVIDIIRKTWAKMSPKGQEAALALPLDADMLAIVSAALSEDE